MLLAHKPVIPDILSLSADQHLRGKSFQLVFPRREDTVQICQISFHIVFSHCFLEKHSFTGLWTRRDIVTGGPAGSALNN